MAKCDCGADSNRLRTSGFEKGELRTICPACEPGQFAEAFRDPSDNKIYLGPEVYPHLYKRDAEGKYHAKDELVADTAALMRGKSDEELWREKRAKTRRTTPMSQDEIDSFSRGPVAQAIAAAEENRRQQNV